MIKREIKRFDVEPLFDTALSESDTEELNHIFAIDFQAEKPNSTVEYNAEVFADDAALAANYAYLRLRDIRQPARLYVNDELLGDIDGNSPSLIFSIKDKFKHGSNMVSIKFNRDECRYPGLIGIFTPPEILRFADAAIDRVHVTQTHDDGIVIVGIKVDLLGSTENVHAVATLKSPSGQLYYAGLTKGEGSIKITDPLYWCPRELGVQNLYKLSVNLYGDGDVEDSLEMKIGLRAVEQTDEGRALLINGLRFFPMGATYHADYEPDKNTYLAKEEQYVRYAAMSHYGCLVLPVGAPRPSERFFELCDERGIVVIEQTDSLHEGMLDAIENRSRHACYCLLEIVGADNTEYIEECLNTVLPNLAFSLLPEAPSYISAPSLPSDKTLATVIPEGERNLFSRSVEAIAPDGAIGEMMLSVAERYPYPATLSDFAYVSALASANKVGEAIKKSRMSRGKSGRAVFDRLGDSFPSISSSALDSYSRWKPLQYYAARHFAPIALYAEMTDGGVLFSVSNERKYDFIGAIEYRIATSKNDLIYQGSEACEVSAMTSRELFTRDFSEHTRLYNDACYIEYSLKEGSSIVSHGTLLFSREKYFRFVDPEIKFVITGSDRTFDITLLANAFAKNVELDFVDMDAVMSDNYFDITSSNPVKIRVTFNEGPQSVFHLENSLQIRTMYDLKL